MVDSNVGVFLKPFLILAITLIVAAYVVVKSGTLEMREESYTRNGFPYKRTVMEMHWDRVVPYLKSLPDRVKKHFE
jgi:hypothetical protein